MPSVKPNLHTVLARGFLPKELPPCFDTVAFADFADKRAGSLRSQYAATWTKSARYNLVRPGGGRRVLSIPNPFGYLGLASTLLEDWKTIASRCAASTLSQSTPRVGVVKERAVLPRNELKSLFELRLQNRAASGFMVRADVLDFYGSIYTHSIPWAITGKTAAKKRTRSKGPLPWPDRLDAALRCVQDGQTNGIDVGPDTSFVISELLLSTVDADLVDKGPGLRGFRYYDDYELYFAERGEAEEGLAALQDALLEYELVLNPRKTEVVALPQPLDYGWALELRRTTRGIERRRSQRDSLVDLFEQAFRLIAGGTREHVLRYAVGLTQDVTLRAENWPVYEKLLWQASHIEPAILPAVLGEILRYDDTGSRVDKMLAGEVLNRHILRSLRQSFSHEVAWAIWGLIALDLPLEPAVCGAACRVIDPIIGVMMMNANEKGRAGKGFSTAAWADAATPESLRSSLWLLAYEAGLRGLKLAGTVPGKGWNAGPVEALFEDLKRAGVGFTVDRYGYSAEEFDSDEYDYSLDDDALEDDEDDESDDIGRVDF